MRVGIIALLLLGVARAQEVIAPTPERVGPARGDNVSEYNIVNSFETGYRWNSLGGNLDQYRSQVNYDSGVRLLGSFLTVNSRDGHGRFFDEIVLSTQGLGNDPYESATLRVQKNHVYRYDMTWRLNDYVNPGLTSGGAESGHAFDTRYTTQDNDLTIFPESKIKFFLGYSRGVQEGPAVTSVGGLDPTRDSFPAFSQVRDARNEYRIGNELEIFGIKLNWTRGWEDFKEDFATAVTTPQSPILASDGTTLSSFTRTNPYHGTSPYWRVALLTSRKWFSANGRFTYTGSRRAFVLQESGLLGGLTGIIGGRQIVTIGSGRRPVTTGNLTLSVFPTSKLTITNSTAYYSVRTEGNSLFTQVNDGTSSFDYRSFQYLGIHTFTNQTDLNYQAGRWLGFYGGYHYSNRKIRSILDPSIPAFDQSNRLNAGVFGIRLRPMQPVTIVLDGEIGSADRPFTPKSDRAYHALGARVQYKHKSLVLSAYTRANYDNNSITLTAYSSHARTYAADVAWAPLPWLSFDADYSKLHLDTLGGLQFFIDGSLTQGQRSLYISNLHTSRAGVRFAFQKRADLYVAYSHVQDTGDGRSTLEGQGVASTLPNFQAAQTFPLKYLSPMARLSVTITNRIRWNLGYQYYGYHEQFYDTQNYRAHTGYTSVLWSF